MNRERAAVKTYGALTRLYPRQFRDEYGVDMVSLFREQCRDESTWRVLPRAAVDLAVTIPTQHLEARMRRSPSPLVALIYLAIALAGVWLAIMGGTEPSILIVGLAIAVGAGALSILTWRRAAPTRQTSVTASWWKFLVGGPSLVVIVLAAAAVGVEAWLLGMTVLLAALVLTALGVVLGVSHLFVRRTRTA